MAVNHVSPDHADHDELRIAAYAAGDLDGSELAAATDQIDSCTACARLADDLGLIRAATRELPAPQRTRDFRLTEADADRLRPRGWRRFIVPLGGPRFSFTQPLAAGLATLGLVGILLATLPAGLGGFGASSEVTNVGGALETSGDRVAAPEAQPSGAAGGADQAPSLISPEPSASAGAAALAPSEAVPSEPPAAATDAGAAAGTVPEAGGPSVSQKDLAVGTTRDESATGRPSDLAIVSLTLLVGGLGLLALRFGARRIAAG